MTEKRLTDDQVRRAVLAMMTWHLYEDDNVLNCVLRDIRAELDSTEEQEPTTTEEPTKEISKLALEIRSCSHPEAMEKLKKLVDGLQVEKHIRSCFELLLSTAQGEIDKLKLDKLVLQSSKTTKDCTIDRLQHELEEVSSERDKLKAEVEQLDKNQFSARKASDYWMKKHDEIHEGYSNLLHKFDDVKKQRDEETIRANKAEAESERLKLAIEAAMNTPEDDSTAS